MIFFLNSNYPSLNDTNGQQNFQQQSNGLNTVQLAATSTKSAVSDQTNILLHQQQQQQQQAIPIIPGTSVSTDYPIQPAVASQYFLDPNGQYLMYPTPGWQ